MSTATGVREVPAQRSEVWRAVAVLRPYCATCDVSYVVTGSGRGARFVAVSGRLDGPPPEGAPVGEIVEWAPGRVVATRLELTPETWTTRVELADTADGGTRVTMTVTHEPRGGSRLLRLVQGRAARVMVRRTVESELDKVPAHLADLRS